MNETIAAIATSTGIASISIIRISGEKAFDIILKIFKTKDNKIEPNTIKYGYIEYAEKIIDEVLVSFFVAPHSFTKENVCEINCHGGEIITKEILEIVIKAGARLAQPGEFTKRAFLNGRIDLVQAEAVIDIINAKTKRSLKESEKQLHGNLSEKIQKIELELLDVISDMEANIDYPEYDIEQISKLKIKNVMISVKDKLDKLKKSFDTGKIIKEGLTIALVGKPNVGKSSVLNMMLREDRAIVTEIEGTTRDTIEEYILIKDIPFKIIDTAGIRETDNIIEKIGVEKSIHIIDSADIVLVILDSSNKLNEEDYEILEKTKNKNTIIVCNKSDLEQRINISNEYKVIRISAKKNEGKDLIEEEIFNMCKLNNISNNNDVMITNLRHKDIIERALNNIINVIERNEDNIPLDIIAIQITETLNILGEITGRTVSEDIISSIFSKFCLGK